MKTDEDIERLLRHIEERGFLSSYPERNQVLRYLDRGKTVRSIVLSEKLPPGHCRWCGEATRTFSPCAYDTGGVDGKKWFWEFIPWCHECDAEYRRHQGKKKSSS